MAKTRRAYKGAAVSTTTTSAIASSGTTSFSITAYTGWPYGSDPFFIVVEPGTANEEKMLVTRTGSTDLTLNVYSTPTVAANRGLDGTSAAAHSSGSTVYPVFTATDADEANEIASTLTTKGDILTHSSTTFTRVAVGTNDYVLTADSSQTGGLKWGQVQTAGIATDAVTAAKIASGAVGSDELASNAVTTAKITDANVTTAKIADANVTTAKIADSNITTAKIADSNVTTAKIADANVTTAKIADSAVTEAKLGLTELKLTASTSHSSAQSGTLITWTTEDADTSGFITVSSDTITVPSGKNGLYSIALTGSISSGNSANTLKWSQVQVNSNAVGFTQDSITVSDAGKVYQSWNLYLEAGDTLKFPYNMDWTSGTSTVSFRLWMTRIMD